MGTVNGHTIYKVRPGDSLWAIAERELGSGAKWSHLAHLNRLGPPYRILAGQTLLLPAAPGAAAASATPRPTPASAPTPTPRSSPRPAPAAPPVAITPALPVLFPAFEIKPLSESVTTLYPGGSMTVSVELKGTLQDTRDPSGIVLDQHGAFEYTREAETAVRRIAAVTKVKVNPSDGTAEIGCGYATRIGDVVVNTQTVTVVPPNGVKYTYKPQELSGRYRHYTFTIEVEVEATVTREDGDRRQPSTSPVTRPVAAPGREWEFGDLTVGQWVTLGAAAAGATALVAFAVANNVSVIGFADDAVAFSLALRILQAGMPAGVR